MQLIFYHVPKTAGTTFRNLLKGQYKKNKSFFMHDLFPEQSINYLNNLPDNEFNKIKLIAGHGTQFIRERNNYTKRVIFLRDPYKQIISRFHHVKRSTFNRNYNRFKSIKTLEDYYFYLDDTNGFNMQVDYLSHDFESFINNLPNNKSSDQKLIDAKLIIDKCQYPLITEDFNSGVIILMNELNWSYPLYSISNKTKKKLIDWKGIKISEKIKEKQKLDYLLYEYVKLRYTNLKAENLAYLDSKAKKFRKLNKLYQFYKYPQIILKNRLLEILRISQNKWLKKPNYD